MAIILVFFLLLFIGLLIYKRSFKTVIIFLIIVLGLVYFLYMVGIEDYYGRNNHVYFDGKENDTVILIDRSTKQVLAKWQIQRKSWDRVFLKSEKDTLELNEWIEQKAGYMADVKCILK